MNSFCKFNISSISLLTIFKSLSTDNSLSTSSKNSPELANNFCLDSTNTLCKLSKFCEISTNSFFSSKFSSVLLSLSVCSSTFINFLNSERSILPPRLIVSTLFWYILLNSSMSKPVPNISSVKRVFSSSEISRVSNKFNWVSFCLSISSLLILNIPFTVSKLSLLRVNVSRFNKSSFTLSLKLSNLLNKSKKLLSSNIWLKSVSIISSISVSFIWGKKVKSGSNEIWPFLKSSTISLILPCNDCIKVRLISVSSILSGCSGVKPLILPSKVFPKSSKAFLLSKTFLSKVIKSPGVL